MKSVKKLRVVVDTNVLVSGVIVPHGNPYKIILLLLENRISFIFSNALHKELADVLSRSKFANYITSKEQKMIRTRLLEQETTNVNLSPNLTLRVRDTKDEIILCAAIEGKADYIITGDEDLLVLNGSPELGKLKIVTAKVFLSIIG